MKLKQFQREDFARLAIHDGGILAHDTGLGKTIAAYTWPLLKVGALCKDGGSSLRADHPPLRRPLCPAAPVLIVAAQDLHAQIIAEGQLHFGVTPTPIENQDAYLDLLRQNKKPGARGLAPGFFLTNYIALSRNGIRQLPGLHELDTASMSDLLGLQWKDYEDYFNARGSIYRNQYDDLGVTPEDSLAAVTRNYHEKLRGASTFMRDALNNAYAVIKHLAPPKTFAISGKTDSVGKLGHQISLHDLTQDQQQFVRAWTVAAEHADWKSSIGKVKRLRPKDCDAGLCALVKSAAADGTLSPRHPVTESFPVKCVLSPSLADLCQDAFAVVVYDEGTRLKGEDTIMGMAARQMNPPYRLVLSATPIKNRLPDVFRLIHWSAGAHNEATARCPFGDDDRETFSEEFSVTERNLSAEDRDEAGRRYVKKTAQVCNIHRLWKLIAPIILRRRKADCGEQIVARTRNVIRVPMGKQQAEVYRYHLEAEYRDKNEKPAIGAKLQALRIAAANPASQLLERKPLPPWLKIDPNSFRSGSSFIPKVSAALSVITDILDRGEQFVVFSAFHDSLDSLAARLNEAGVRHLVLDGRAAPAKRGAFSAKFQVGPPKHARRAEALSGGGSHLYPGLLAGIECMSEGHSYPRCNNVILLSYSWAMDKIIQSINRVHRLNSVADINVYAIICDGSIDRKLEGNIQEKEEASELVLDGHLLGDNPEEVNYGELLRVAEAEFAANRTSFVDEKQLTIQWSALRTRLAASMVAWDRPVIALPATRVPVRSPAPEPAPVGNNREFSDLPLFRLAA